MTQFLSLDIYIISAYDVGLSSYASAVVLKRFDDAFSVHSDSFIDTDFNTVKPSSL